MERKDLSFVTPAGVDPEVVALANRPVDWAKVKHIHLIGICGTGMGSLAGLFKLEGFHVTGSDENVYPPMSLFLEKLQIPVVKSYQPGDLPKEIDVIIVGNACRRDHPQVLEAVRRKIALRSFPAAISEHFLASRSSVVICGTHGKTTTSSMMSYVLEQAGQKPSYLIGGVPIDLPDPMALGKGRHFVIEGDEYDTAFYDKIAKFVHYKPQDVILTSVEYDHADIYPDFDAYKKAFTKLMELTRRSVVAWAGAKEVMEVTRATRAAVVPYALATDKTSVSARWLGRVCDQGEWGTELECSDNGKVFLKFRTHLSGEGNMRNWLAVVAMGAQLGLSAEEIRAGAENFHGVRRRQEVSGVVDDCIVIDDFAHHPTAVFETLKGLRARYANRRLWAIFEPRTQTSCRRVFQKDYVTAFQFADKIIVAKPFRELPPEVCFKPEELIGDIVRSGKDARFGADTASILATLEKELRPGDVAIIMSNGAFDNIHQKLLKCLKNRIHSSSGKNS
jgi:UDP-N-acetylmuramate: L-alanyl-gamma-D-glutamyl-meso-diaminopimelate ligase